MEQKMNIRKILMAGLSAVLLSTFAMADLYFEQRTTISGIMGQPAQTSLHKVWMTKGLMCTEDASRGNRIIYKADTNSIIIIDFNKKTYSEITAAEFKQMAGMFMSMMGQPGGVLDITLQKTGRTKKIGSWDCYEVTLVQKEGMNLKIEMWLTADINYDKTQYEEYQKIFSSAFLTQKVLDEWKKLEGFPVLTNTQMNFGQMQIETKSEVIKVNYNPAPHDIFSIPAGFTKTEYEMPQMPH
jgi:hypothetical protein